MDDSCAKTVRCLYGGDAKIAFKIGETVTIVNRWCINSGVKLTLDGSALVQEDIKEIFEQKHGVVFPNTKLILDLTDKYTLVDGFDRAIGESFQKSMFRGAGAAAASGVAVSPVKTNNTISEALRSRLVNKSSSSKDEAAPASTPAAPKKMRTT